MARASIPFNLAGKRIFVAGHNGMAGSAIIPPDLPCFFGPRLA
jgi:hypothetical protein